MLDERQKRLYEKQWQVRENDRLAQRKAARKFGRIALAGRTNTRQSEKRPDDTEPSRVA